MILRPAEAEDLPQLAAFWNGIIRETTITFTTVLKTEESLSAMIKARRAAGREFFVAREGTAIGFASYDQFRSGPGYAHAMEHTILLRKELECSPCQLKVCPLDHHRCMRDITVDEVVAAGERLLARAAPVSR